ncbi:MAG: hypothetical protein M1347_07955 [Chloroflexi bacterium]|nr:hypothetical protein [Chloroflexota bacterium]
MKNIWLLIVLVALVVVFLLIRVNAYEPIGYSISTYDTQAFITAGRVPFFSREFFTSDRPATISLFYKLLQPASGYQITAFASPAEDIYQPPAIQPGLQRVAFAQGLLSISAWLLLAVIVVRRLTNPGLKIIAGLLILAFGFSPTIAEWDAVLLSEPLSLTLFVILLAISIELAFRFAQQASAASWTKALFAFWGVVLLLWIFARDTNAYMLLIFIAALGVLLVLRWQRKFTGLLSTRALIVAIASLALLFVIHNFTLQQSGRWINPFFNNILHNVFPYPDRIAFFESKGMPITDEVWALRNSPGNEDGFFEIPELMSWTNIHGTSTYMQFLLAFPGWAFEKFFTGVETSFSENRQPFFFPNEYRTAPAISYIGDLLHPKSSSVIWIVLIELAVFGYLAFRRDKPPHIALFLLLATLFLGEILMLFVSIHGDALGTVRHAMGSVMPLRLSVWLFLPFILDMYGLPEDKSIEARKLKRNMAKQKRVR